MKIKRSDEFYPLFLHQPPFYFSLMFENFISQVEKNQEYPTAGDGFWKFFDKCKYKNFHS